MFDNGRLARFLMNFLLVTSGFSWTIIRISERSRYMSAIDYASTYLDIRPLDEVIMQQMQYWQGR